MVNPAGRPAGPEEIAARIKVQWALQAAVTRPNGLTYLPNEAMPRGRCWCGCNLKTNIAAATRAIRSQFKGIPNRYIYGHDGDKAPLRIRLFRQLVIDPSGCLLWQGEIEPDGYGRIKIDGQKYQVHRVVYELWVEPIPSGMEVDHVRDRGCRNRNCAAPAHLEAVTSQENRRRAPGRGPARVRDQKKAAA